MHFKTETIVGIFILIATGIFLYMGFQLGSMHLDLARYATYRVGFKDVAGLASQGDIKIAGVKVGYVDDIKLVSAGTSAEVIFKILKEYALYADAHAFVRQEGMLGVKFLEVMPGNPATGRIPAGGTLPFQERQFVGMDECFYTFQQLGNQIEELSASFKGVSHEAQGLLQDLREHLKPLNSLLAQFAESATSVTHSLESATQSVKQTADKVSGVLDDAQIPLKKIGEFAQTVHEGEGSLGKMLTDSTLYEDIKTTSEYARGCIERVRNIAVAADSHIEVLPRSFHDRGRTHDRNRTNVKWYLDTRFYPCENLFGSIGLVYSQEGFARRVRTRGDDCDIACIKNKSNALRLNLQAGAWFRPGFGFRVGIFEGTAGVSFDSYVPFGRLHWWSSFEAFDFKGHNRFVFDSRVHLKWLNRLFINPHFYLSFGADDFISRCNKSGFFGFGAFFSTCDLFCCP